MNGAKTLLRLQEIDQEMASLTASISDLRGRGAESEEVRAARRRVAKLKERLSQARRLQRDRELQLEADSEKLGQSRNELYSGAIQHPKQLQALEDEVGYLTRRVDQLQDGVLETLMAIEEIETELEGAEPELAGLEQEWQARQAQASDELQRLSARLAELSREREALRSRMKPADVELYDDLRRRKGLTPVAHLAGGTCQGCGVTVPVAQARQARDPEERVFCSSCGRLLIAD